MANINEGDVIEGIFAIAVALFLSDDKIVKNKLNVIRTKIDPSLFDSGRVRIEIGKMIQKSLSKRPPDFFNVNLEVRLKKTNVTGAFGKQFEMLYKKASDIGDLDKKIDQIISSQTGASWAGKMSAAKNTFLSNNVGEIVTFDVVADGIAGESTGGDIKADIEVKIFATTKRAPKKIIFDDTLSYSIKSQSVTVANLSPYNGMKSIAKALKLEWKDITKYEVLEKTAKTEAEKAHKFKVIIMMYNELKKLILAKGEGISNDAYSFLQKSIFGSDLAEVVDIRSGSVKEITLEYFEQLRKTVKLKPMTRGDNLVFVDAKTDTPIFQLRTRLRPPPAARGAGEAKFLLEVGRGIYD